jgi:hypothetical protein
MRQGAEPGFEPADLDSRTVKSIIKPLKGMVSAEGIELGKHLIPKSLAFQRITI